ncbi:MAG: SDR family oxidoreductase [Actinobacteria bacterium]|nr:SDR family oxidoreductase [Actinomycetota bacterium]
MTVRFSNRNVIVTGAAQGIGRGIVEAFLREGALVFAADINADGLRRMRAAQAEGDRVLTHVVDLADRTASSEMTREAIARVGRIHVLVNCAGVMPDGPLVDVAPETFDLVFAVNVRAPLVTMQAVAPNMAEHGGGAIVNIASANAFKNESPEGVYNASKAALVALTKAAAHELGHVGIRANCVAPGQTVTPEEMELIARDPDEARLQREYLRRIPLRRAGTPHDQAMAVLFLASDDAAWISGQTLIVDGGEVGGGDWYDPSAGPPLPDE